MYMFLMTGPRKGAWVYGLLSRNQPVWNNNYLKQNKLIYILLALIWAEFATLIFGYKTYYYFPKPIHINSGGQPPPPPYSVSGYCKPGVLLVSRVRKPSHQVRGSLLGMDIFFSRFSMGKKKKKKRVWKEDSKNSLFYFSSSSLYKVLNTFLKEN